MAPNYSSNDHAAERRLAHRRRDPDDGIPQGSLQWAQLVLKMTSASAVIVIAGFLVWRLAGGFDLFAQKMDVITMQHAELSAQHADLTSQNRTADAASRRILVVLRIMCVQGAKTEQARQSCLHETIP